MLANEASALKPRPGNTVRYTTLVNIRAQGRRVQHLWEGTKQLNRMLWRLMRGA